MYLFKDIVLKFSQETESIYIFTFVDIIYIKRYMEMYYEEFAHETTKAERSHGVPSVSWKLRKVGGVVSVCVRKPENPGSQGVNPSPGAADLAQGRREKWQSPPSSAFCSLEAPKGVDGAHPHCGRPSTSLS